MMLIGTYLHQDSYVIVGVEFDHAERPGVVLERHDRPGVRERRARLLHESLGAALRQAESHPLSRGWVLGAEPPGLAGSPVGRELAESMFSQKGIGRFVHLPVRRGPW
jgi:hypothetical protein